MIVKLNKKNSEGRDIYKNVLDGREGTLIRARGKNRTYLPDYVYGSFRKPQPSPKGI